MTPVMSEAPATTTAALPGRSPSVMPAIIATVLVIAALKLGRAVTLPVVVALLLALMLSAPVRWLHRIRIPERIAAALVIFGALGASVGAVVLVASPAREWTASAPETLRKLESRIQRLVRPIAALQESADRMQRATTGPVAASAPATVQIASPGILARASLETLSAVPTVLAVVFLTYFLLANGPLVHRKLAGLRPGSEELTRRGHLFSEIQLAASHYLATVTVINASVGVLTALALWAVGVPSPFLWGGIAAVLNFVPYLGPVLTATIIAGASLVSITDTGHALLAPAAFLIVHLTESNFVTPMLLGRHLPVNTVAIFLGLLFFAWMWGIPGAVIAVPLTVCVKLVCDYVPSLRPMGQLLDA
jgi:predicted PurR-regulated permease PerM